MQTQQCRRLCQSLPPPSLLPDLPPFNKKKKKSFCVSHREIPGAHPAPSPLTQYPFCAETSGETEGGRSPLVPLPCCCSLDIMSRVFPNSWKELIYGAAPSCWALPKMDRCKVVTWLFSARHWQVSNYRFSVGGVARQCGPVFPIILKEDLKTAKEHYTRVMSERVCLPVTAHIPAVCLTGSPRPHAPHKRPAQRRAAPRSAASPAAPGRLVCVSLKVFPSFIDAAQEAIYIPGSSHLSRYLPEQQHVSALRPPVAATRQRRLSLNMCQVKHKPVLFRARDLRVRSHELRIRA